jgi:hypothetical protein
MMGSNDGWVVPCRRKLNLVHTPRDARNGAANPDPIRHLGTVLPRRAG